MKKIILKAPINAFIFELETDGDSESNDINFVANDQERNYGFKIRLSFENLRWHLEYAPLSSNKTALAADKTFTIVLLIAQTLIENREHWSYYQ